MIRAEAASDRAAIATVVSRAFGSPSEAQLVAAIRESPNYVASWSLVAVVDQSIVGHVMLSYMNISDGTCEHRIASLSPLSVDPDYQRRGIGTALVHAAVSVAESDGEPLIVLEGNPAFYSRFGFEHAVPLGITNRFSTPSTGRPIFLKETP